MATLRASALALLLALAGCARPVWIDAVPAPEPGVRVMRIALVPLVEAAQVERPGASVKDVEAGAGDVIAARVVEALALQGEIECVAPVEVALWLERQGLASGGVEPARVGAELAAAFGVDAVLSGHVRRYASRVGGAHGALHPAAVWFDLELRLPGGAKLWGGTYREEQKAVLEDMLLLRLAAGRGFEWLDAPALAEYGARELVASLVEERRRWR